MMKRASLHADFGSLRNVRRTTCAKLYSRPQL